MRLIFACLCLRFLSIASAPIGSATEPPCKRLGEGGENDPKRCKPSEEDLVLEDENKCLFKDGRTTSNGPLIRKLNAEISSSCAKYSIPNSLRLQRAAEIVSMFKQVMKEKNMENMILGTSTLYKILSYCSATQRSASVCVDYFFSESESAFDYLEELSHYLVKKNGASPQWKADIAVKIRESRFYLKGDYRLHTKNNSRISDHCWKWSLSDPQDTKFSSTCSSKIPGEDHTHSLKCGRCEMIKEMLLDFKEHLQELQKKVTSDETLSEEVSDHLARLQEAEERISEYKKHQLRSAYSYKVRENIISGLKEDTALITLDFSQKFIPLRYREAQVEYFGKKGLSFHVSHIMTKKNGLLHQHSMVHIIQNDKQDSLSVIQIVKHVLTELTKLGIVSAHFRSDNAPSYHCGSTIASIFKISKELKLASVSYGFSESQNGKSACDRVSGLVKSKVRAFVDTNKNARTHEELFTAATSGRLLEATSFFLVSVKHQETPKVKIDKISDLYDFELEKDGIRAWRYSYIGAGTLIPESLFNKLADAGKLDIHKQAGHLPDAAATNPSFWKVSPLPKDVPQSENGPDTSSPEKRQFHCPELTCDASFDTEAELDAHWLAGKHSPSPLKMTLRDAALRMFLAGLEETAKHRLNLPEVDDAVKELEQTEDDGSSDLPQGFSLKKRKAAVRFSKSVKDFIEKLFFEGIAHKRKLTPEEAEKRMREERSAGKRKFSPEERLNARQISSFFSRLASQRESKGDGTGSEDASRLKREADPATDTTPAHDEIDGDDIDNAVFEDAWFISDEDRLLQDIYTNREEIFDFNQDVEEDYEELVKPNPTRGADQRRRRAHRHYLHHPH